MYPLGVRCLINKIAMNAVNLFLYGRAAFEALIGVLFIINPGMESITRNSFVMICGSCMSILRSISQYTGVVHDIRVSPFLTHACVRSCAT